MTNQNIQNAWNNFTASAIELGKVGMDEFIKDVQQTNTDLKKEIAARKASSSSAAKTQTATAKKSQTQVSTAEAQANLDKLKESGEQLFDMLKQTVKEATSVN